jgi:hypothetical protein
VIFDEAFLVSLAEEFIQKKENAEKVFFYLHTTLEKNESGRATTSQRSSAAFLAGKKTQIFASFATNGNIARVKILP